MSDIPYHRIVSQFYNRPLFLLPSAAETVSAFLLDRVRAGRAGAASNERGGESVQAFRHEERADGSVELHSPRASRFYGDWVISEDGRRPEPYRRTADGTAIITVVGELVNRGAWIGANSGLVSYEGIKFQLARAAADQRVNAIVLDIESPGGEAVGAFEAAAAVREAAKSKEVVAVVNGVAASAAYAIASGATRIVTMPTGISGSIGVVMLHLDFSKYLDKEGVKPTFIFAGDHKVDGNMFEALPNEVRERMQVEVDSFYAQFVETVVAGRKMLTGKDVRGTQADVFKGEEAVNAGLADEIGTFEGVLQQLSQKAAGRASQQQEKRTMTNSTSAPAASAGITQADFDAAIARAHAEGVASAQATHTTALALAKAEAAKAERDRVAGIRAAAFPGQEKLADDMIADGVTTVEQAAVRFIAAEKQSRASHLQGIKDVETAAKGVTAAPTAGADAPSGSNASTPDEWKAEYAKSPALQKEFGSEAGYVAYMQANSDGRVKILRGRAA